MVSEKYIAERIRKLRKEAGLDVDTVGAAVGRSGKTVSAWETGRNVPSADMLISICRYFGVSIDYFYPDDVSYSFVELPDENGMLSDERELLDCYRRMDKADKSTFLDMARTLALAGDVKKKDARGAASGDVEVVSQ